MRKLTLLITTLFLSIGMAWAQEVNLAFTKTGTNTADVAVTATDDISGVSANISCNYIWKTLNANSETFPNASMLCPDKNTKDMTSGNEGVFTISIDNFPAGFNIQAITFTSAALNGNGNFQGDAANAQQIDFILKQGDAEKGKVEGKYIKVNSGGGEQVEVTFDNVLLTKVDDAYTFTLTLANNYTAYGCFYGLFGIKLELADVAGATSTLTAAINATKARVGAITVGEGLGEYSTSMTDYAAQLEAIEAYQATITDNTSVAEIEEKTTLVTEIKSSFSLNMPETGKYYRFRKPGGNYMLSDKYSEDDTRLAMGSGELVSAIFYYGEDNSLRSFASGLYLPVAIMGGNWTCVESPAAATFGEGSVAGTYGFYVGSDDSRAYFSGRDTYVDAGGQIAQGAGYDWAIEEVKALPVASIGNVGYATLAAAVSAATAGQTITFIADITENVTLNKNLTIDGAEKTFKGSIYLNKSNGYFTIKNVNFEGNGDNYAITSNASVTKFNVENCTAKNYPYGFLYAKKSMGTATVKDVTVEGCNYGVHSVYGTDLTLENFTANGTTYAIMVQNYGVRNVTLKNCSLTDCENPLVIWERNQTNKITFNFEGVNEMGKSEFCTSAMAVINADAVVGTKVYETLAAAVAAAQEGETVALRRNVQLNSYVAIDKSITLDLGNYNVTRDGGTALYVNGTDINVTINGENGQVTGYQALFVKNGAVKVNGGKFHGTSKNSEAVYVIENGKVEIYGGTFSGSGESNFVLNEYDATREATDITVYGGTFVGFNPANNAAEGVGTSFVADNYVVADNGDGSYSVAVDPAYGKVAKIDDDYYETLAEAVEAAEAGATVTMISDATGAGVVINKNIIIDFNGKTYTVNQTVGSAGTTTLGFQILKDNNVTLMNGTLTSTAVTEGKEVKMLIQNYANLTLEDMHLVDNTEHILYVLSNNCGDTELNGNTNITTDAVAFDSYKYGSYAAPTVTVNTTGKIEGAIEKNDGATIAITSGTYTVDVTEWCAEGYMAQQNTEGNYAVVVDPAYGKVAKIDDDYYETLSAAITAATAGQTITFLADITENVTISKSVTIDGAGKQYTGKMAGNAGLTVTVKNVAFVNAGFVKDTKSTTGTYTFTDCTFDGAGTYAYPLSFKGAKTINVENCTVKDYQYSFLYVRSATLNVNVQDVTVDNCRSYAVYFASGVTTATFEGLTVKNGNNGFVIDNTAVRNLTIKDCSMENVTTAINHANGAKAINCTALGLNDFGTAAVSEYVKFNAEAQAGAVVGELAGVVAAAQENATVTLLRDVTLTTETYVKQNDGYAVLVNAEKTMTIDLNGKNIVVNAAADDLNGKMLLAVFHAEPGAHLTLTDSSAEGTANVTVNVNDATVYSVFSTESPAGTTSGKLTVEGGSYTTVGKLSNAMIFTDTNDAVVINGGNFSLDGDKTGTDKYPWMVNTNGNNSVSVTVNGGTFSSDINHHYRPFEVYVPETLALRNNGDGTWTVVPAVAYVTEMLGSTVNSSGDNAHKVGYATLAEAIEADENVTLVADATGAGVVINKDVTIDFNGKTYTVNQTVGSAGTTTLGFQILKDNNVTLKNGTLTSTAVTEGKEVKMLIQNYANLTLEDMNLVDETDHILYVLSNNCGDTELIGETNITTDAVAFDSYKYGSYAAPTVTVNTTGKIEGAIEKNDGATIAITSGTFTAEILPEWCAEYYVPVQNEDGTYTVAYTYVEEKTIVDGSYDEFVNETEKTVGTLTYQRTFNEKSLGKWQALYVPFEIPVETLTELGYEVAFFYDVHFEEIGDDGEINLESNFSVHLIKVKEGTLRANFPYVIKPTTTEALSLSLVLNDVKLHSTAASEMNSVESGSTTTHFVFAGTYKRANRSELTGDDATPFYVVSTSGVWQTTQPTARLGAFRVYLSILAKDGSPIIMPENVAESIQMRVIGEENEDGTTTIYDVEADEQTVDYIYDLQGRRVLEPQKGGLYIVNGKKVVF